MSPEAINIIPAVLALYLTIVGSIFVLLVAMENRLNKRIDDTKIELNKKIDDTKLELKDDIKNLQEKPIELHDVNIKLERIDKRTLDHGNRLKVLEAERK